MIKFKDLNTDDKKVLNWKPFYKTVGAKTKQEQKSLRTPIRAHIEKAENIEKTDYFEYLVKSQFFTINKALIKEKYPEFVKNNKKVQELISK